MNKIGDNKSGQVTIFIILAIIIIAAVVLFFVLKSSKVAIQTIPASLEPPYTTFLSCLQEDALIGIRILESQGGYIELPAFESGSSYMPFSSQLNFVGTNVPYWYYVSGNNIQKEQVPSKENMEKQLEDFIRKRAGNCNFDSYYENGFEISKGEPEPKVSINSNKVEIDLKMDLSISKVQENILVSDHKISVDSELGGLYDSAREIYSKEQEELFLEEYGVDILRLYAPVDGVELTCSPLVWNADEVFNTLEEAIETNTMALKPQGDKDDYFSVGLNTNHEVRFLNSRYWSNSFDVSPSEGPVLMSNPVGNQPGLGILGFCYVPYHFVYNLGYPVLIQVQEGDEIFQFPVAVVLRGNKPRVALSSSAVDIGIPELCKYKNTLIEVVTRDFRNDPIDAEISYECSGTTCYIGKSENGVLEANFPQCVNGRIIARAEDYEETKEPHSSVNSEVVEIDLDKLYDLDVVLKVDGDSYTGEAVITFTSEEVSKTIFYPEQKNVKLSQGEYEIQVYIYENSSLKLESSISEQCVETPKGGLGGLIGLTEKKCFEVEIPEQIISNALSGGGKEIVFALETSLERGNIEIDVESLPKPTSLEQLQINYLLFENRGLDVEFR